MSKFQVGDLAVIEEVHGSVGIAKVNQGTFEQEFRFAKLRPGASALILGAEDRDEVPCLVNDADGVQRLVWIPTSWLRLLQRQPSWVRG